MIQERCGRHAYEDHHGTLEWRFGTGFTLAIAAIPVTFLDITRLITEAVVVQTITVEIAEGIAVMVLAAIASVVEAVLIVTAMVTLTVVVLAGTVFRVEAGLVEIRYPKGTVPSIVLTLGSITFLL